MNKERLWTKEFILNSLVNFLLVLAMFALMVTIAPYTISEYNAPMSLAGLASSIFIIGVLIGRLYAGWKVNDIGSKKLLIIGVIVFIVASSLFFLQINVYIIILLRLLQGIGFGLGANATGTIVAQIIPSTRSGEGIGIFSMGVVLATAIGPLIGTSLINIYNYKVIFLFSVLIGSCAFILSLFINSPKTEVDQESNAKFIKWNNLIEVRVIPIAIVVLIGALIYSGIVAFVTTYASEINLKEVGGYFFLAYSIIILMTRPLSGRIMDNKGENIIIYPAFILFAVGMLLLSQSTNNFIFILAALLIGLGYGNFQSITQALAVKITPKERMGLANSTYFIFFDIGMGLGPFILGFIIPLTGFRFLYLSFGGVILLNAVLYYLVYGRGNKRIESDEKVINDY